MVQRALTREAFNLLPNDVKFVIRRLSTRSVWLALAYADEIEKAPNLRAQTERGGEASSLSSPDA